MQRILLAIGSNFLLDESHNAPAPCPNDLRPQAYGGNEKLSLDLKIRIILIHITDARRGGLYRHAGFEVLSAVSAVPAEGRADETVNSRSPGDHPAIDQPDSVELQ